MKLRFTIRDLLWLAVVVAVCVAWWFDHSHLSGTRYTIYTFEDKVYIIDHQGGQSWNLVGDKWVLMMVPD
jgi:hypothetical protein